MTRADAEATAAALNAGMAAACEGTDFLEEQRLQFQVRWGTFNDHQSLSPLQSKDRESG